MAATPGGPLGPLVAAWLEGREDLVANPWPLYARLRAEAPVFEQDSVTLVTRYADVVGLLQDPRLSAHKRDNDPQGAKVQNLLEESWLIFRHSHRDESPHTLRHLKDRLGVSHRERRVFHLDLEPVKSSRPEDFNDLRGREGHDRADRWFAGLQLFLECVSQFKSLKVHALELGSYRSASL